MSENLRANHRASTPKPIQILRMTGMLLGALPISTVFIENNVPLYYWLWGALCCFVWPIIAWLHVRYSNNPNNAERINLLLDSFLISSFVPLASFNLLPSVLATTITIADKISSSARNVWFPSLFFMLAAIGLFGLFTDFKTDIHSSTLVIVSCLPLMIVHILTVSIATHRLVRSVRQKNKVLKRYSSTDFLTGLYNKGYWQRKAQAAFATSQAENTELTLALIDSDYFKQINDTFGHLIGDDVLVEIGKIIANTTSHHCLAGRLGGDEFALILHTDMEQATQVMTELKHQVNQVRLHNLSHLTCSISIGLAQRDAQTGDLQELFRQADTALYQAKSQGRNCIVG